MERPRSMSYRRWRWGHGSAHLETGCFLSLVWRGPRDAGFFFGEYMSSQKGNLFRLFLIHILLLSTTGVREKRERTIWSSLHCCLMRLCSCQMCDLHTQRWCRLSPAPLVFNHFPALPTFGPNFHFYLSDAWSNQVEWCTKRSWAPGKQDGANRAGQGCGEVSGFMLQAWRLPDKGGIGGGEWGEVDSSCSRGLRLSQGCGYKWTETWNWEQTAKNQLACMEWKGEEEMRASPGGEAVLGLKEHGGQQRWLPHCLLPKKCIEKRINTTYVLFFIVKTSQSYKGKNKQINKLIKSMHNFTTLRL